MLSWLHIRGFSAIPYLETSTLMSTHGGMLAFSSTKPNVIVGPNGSGKTALLDALAIRFLTYFSDRSTFDRKYVLDVDARAWWARGAGGPDDYVWLPGLDCATDNAPARYYRPGHIPGNELSIGDAAMGAYWEQARDYARLIERKSSGEQNQALLEALTSAFEGRGLPARYEHVNWEFGVEPRDLRALKVQGYGRAAFFKAEVLKSLYRPAPSASPLILMDEPEQSLDARAEASLWASISRADCRRMQVIVATHSVHPLLRRDAYNLIEAEAGFIDQVLALIA